jgi:hypothetical protein
MMEEKKLLEEEVRQKEEWKVEMHRRRGEERA